VLCRPVVAGKQRLSDFARLLILSALGSYNLIDFFSNQFPYKPAINY
jgi:hypothetical protein